MKGMQKIKRGKQFAGVVLYSLKSGSHHKITPYIIGGNMTGSLLLNLSVNLKAQDYCAPVSPNLSGIIRFACQREKHCQSDNGRHSLTII
ncbi:relaxase/mobilization nuclease domain protein [Klebsiella pneumoniae]|nr:relaxase/mobilization nuclease domain protein [Klebsiella pneumoniae]